MNARAQRGLYNGGKVPLGYKLIEGKPGYLAIEENQAQIVRRAFDAFIEHQSLSQSARWLNANGYRYKREIQGGGNKPRLGHFTIENLYDILKNRAYIGIKTYEFKGELKEAPAVWESIIDPKIFHRVHEILKVKHKRKPDSFRKYPYTLSSVLYCGKCKGSLCGRSATGASGKVAYYEHGWLTKKNGCLLKSAFRCDVYRVQAKVIEPLVWGKVEELLKSKEFSKNLIQRANLQYQSNSKRKDIERVKNRIYDLNMQIETLAERLSQLPIVCCCLKHFRGSG